MKSDDIKQNNRTDITVATIKSIAGPIPFVGPMIQEMVDVIIPNQRIDRLSKYVLELEKKLTRFEQEKIENKLKDEYFVDLMEESLIQASKALTNERLEYISSIIENSLDKEHILDIENKHLLTLLKEINDIEIIWLRYYLVPTMDGDVEFRNKHKDVLELISPTLGSKQEERDKAAIQISYKEHLSTLGLLEKKISVKIGGSTNELETKGYKITPLGRLLLKQIGFKNDEWLS
jgi:hypothetical protein